MNARPIKTFLLFALISTLNFGRADRAAADGVIHLIIGYVLDDAGNPVVGLDILGDDYVGDYLNSWPTDTNGYYVVDAITEGNYRLTLNCPQLTALGYRCLAPVAVSVASELTEQHFVVTRATAPVQVTNVSLPRGNVGAVYSAQLGATGGQAPYKWQLAAGSASLPPGLFLGTNGLISGTPLTNLASSIKVQVTDAQATVTNRVLAIIINPRPVLLTPTWLTNRFSLWLVGASNQNYTLQAATSPGATNWTSLLVTNHPVAGSFIVTDPNATNQSRFYRVLIGP